MGAKAIAVRPQPVDWDAFWAAGPPEEDWVIEPFLAKGRSHAMYSPAKTGKSEMALNILARAAADIPVLDRPATGDPLTVIYFDFEMTSDDLYERLQDMGFGPHTDLSSFHYYLLPSLPPLDTIEGGAAVMNIVSEYNVAPALFPVVAVIDTTSRVLEGNENDADTLRAFYMCTGLPLKEAGITTLRLDHSGKDVERGQRGTSAKADDVDIVYLLKRTDKGAQLRATHRRQSWIPEVTDLVRLEDPLRYELAAELTWPTGTAELVSVIDRLGLPPDASSRVIQAALKEAGHPARREVVLAAKKCRVMSGTTPGTTRKSKSGTTNGNHLENRFGNHPRNHPEPLAPDNGNLFPPLEGNRFPGPDLFAPKTCIDCGAPIPSRHSRCDDCAAAQMVAEQ